MPNSTREGHSQDTVSSATVTSTNRQEGSPAPVSSLWKQAKSHSWGSAEQNQREAQAHDLESDTVGQGVPGGERDCGGVLITKAAITVFTVTPGMHGGCPSDNIGPAAPVWALSPSQHPEGQDT